ncbi:MAG: hydroxysqualene dehydroxylase HpnE [Rhodocyclaceae bacterium]|nr:hydroxysqualene dehydroxylase HpnE [Rhodocyclaceae bacterium]MDZ4215111.1 hydroxysqualene dehydroxylase HpnE [Rhodocyclaceae bacterium]
MAERIAIVGAGYAGLACAVELADAGCHVEVFEASRTLGGRARAVTLNGMTVDNGMHLLVGAYRETLRLMWKVGAGPIRSGPPPTGGSERALQVQANQTVLAALRRERLRLEFPGKFKLQAPALPAPFHLAAALLMAQGLRWRDKLAALRFMRALEKCQFRLPRDITAKQLIANQPPTLRRFLWEPLCLAALNTPVAQASGQVFLNVMRDSLAAGRAASDLLFPATDLSTLFPEPAARFIETHGGQIHRERRVGALAELEGFDQRVVAVAPYHLKALLPEIADKLDFSWQPIATVYLQYPAGIGLPFPMLGMSSQHGQWVFDRGQLTGQHGLMAVVISGAGPWQALSHEALGQAVQRELSAMQPNWPAPQQRWVIEDKRATFACTPGLVRPSTITSVPSVWLAGDYVAGDYPATIEGAVRSGVIAARAILSRISTRR